MTYDIEPFFDLELSRGLRLIGEIENFPVGDLSFDFLGGLLALVLLMGAKGVVIFMVEVIGVMQEVEIVLVVGMLLAKSVDGDLLVDKVTEVLVITQGLAVATGDREQGGMLGATCEVVVGMTTE